MTAHTALGGLLRATIGPARTKRLRRAEVRVRRRVSHRIGPDSRAPMPVDPIDPDPVVDHPTPTRTRHEVLAALHERLRPRTYLEIGTDRGESLALARCPAIGVDPAFKVSVPLDGRFRLVQQTSDDFFADPDAVRMFDGVPVDLAFIDGLHLAEFALRDVMNTERLMAPGGVIVVDDTMPRNVLEAARDRCTLEWAGDVYKIVDVLRRLRPDLTLLPVNASPTGSLIILGADPASTVLRDHQAEWERELDTPDPQRVDDAWLHREGCLDAAAVSESPAWDEVVRLRGTDAPAAAYRPLWQELAASPVQ